MPGFIGRKLCPELVIVPLNFEKYTSVSKQVKSIIAEYDANFCPMSLDEAYLDLTEHLKRRQSMPVKERTFLCRDSDYADSRSHCKCDLNEIKSEYAEEDITVDKLNDFFTKSEHFQVVQQDTDLAKAMNIDKEGKCVVCLKCNKVLPPFNLVIFGMSDEDAVNELRTRIEQKTTLTASAGKFCFIMIINETKKCWSKVKPHQKLKKRKKEDKLINNFILRT
jgi:DNA polymerase kappa